MTGESSTSARKVQAEFKQHKALELRLRGWTFERIAEELGYAGDSGARKALSTILRKTREESSEIALEVRELERHRLDHLQPKFYDKAVDGDGDALKSVLSLMTRRAALLGLDAPKRTELTGLDGKPLEVRTGPDLSMLNDEELAEFETITHRASEIFKGAKARKDAETEDGDED